MPAGRRREKVTVESSSLAPDSSGQLVPTWSTHCVRWAESIPFGGGEQVQNQQNQASVTWRLRVRNDPATRAIDPKMRVLFRGRTLNIGRAEDNEGRRRFIDIDCTEKPA